MPQGIQNYECYIQFLPKSFQIPTLWTLNTPKRDRLTSLHLSASWKSSTSIHITTPAFYPLLFKNVKWWCLSGGRLQSKQRIPTSHTKNGGNLTYLKVSVPFKFKAQFFFWLSILRFKETVMFSLYTVSQEKKRQSLPLSQFTAQSSSSFLLLMLVLCSFV